MILAKSADFGRKCGCNFTSTHAVRTYSCVMFLTIKKHKRIFSSLVSSAENVKDKIERKNKEDSDLASAIAICADDKGKLNDMSKLEYF